jgi:hypothetical protein
MDEQNNIQEESLGHDNNINSVEPESLFVEATLESGNRNSGNAEAELNGNITREEASINSYNTANKKGYNKEGYNKEGYNKEGYNKEGYNKEGYINEGYYKETYNNAYDKAYNSDNNISNREAVHSANNAASKEAYFNGGNVRRNEANPKAYSAMGNQVNNNQISVLERQMLLNYNNPLNITSLSNWTKVMLTALVVLLPGIGQIIGIICGLVFVANDRDADRRSYGGALITVSIISFIIAAIFWFMFALSFGPDLYLY